MEYGRAEKVDANKGGAMETDRDPCRGNRQAGICRLLVRQ